MAAPSFYKLDSAIQKRIINAAIDEFTKKGYKLASTNEIVKAANIGKGRLFNYFNSKKELYTFLCQYATEIIEEIYAEIDLGETDFFERIKQIGEIKLRVYKKYPNIFQFLQSIAQEYDPEVKEEIETFKNSSINSGMERIYENIDFSRFRDDIDLKKAVNVINWTMLSIGEKHRDKTKSINDYSAEDMKEIEDYFALLKQCFYKQEEK